MSAQLPLMPDDLEPLLEDLNIFPPANQQNQTGVVLIMLHTCVCILFNFFFLQVILICCPS